MNEMWTTCSRCTASRTRQNESLLQLAREANTPGWWHRYNDVLPGWFQTYVGLEESAALIRTYELQFVPGLLQSEGYARAVIRLGNAGAAEHEIDQRVELRMQRQERLTGPEAPRRGRWWMRGR